MNGIHRAEALQTLWILYSYWIWVTYIRGRDSYSIGVRDSFSIAEALQTLWIHFTTSAEEHWGALRSCEYYSELQLKSTEVLFEVVNNIHNFSESTVFTTSARALLCKLIERTPPPRGGVSYLLCSLIKKREEEAPPWKTSPQINHCWGCFFRGGPPPPGFWWENIRNRKPPRGGGGFFRSTLWILFITSQELQLFSWSCDTHTYKHTHTHTHYSQLLKSFSSSAEVVTHTHTNTRTHTHTTYNFSKASALQLKSWSSPADALMKCYKAINMKSYYSQLQLESVMSYI